MEDSEEELFITPNSFFGTLPDFDLDIEELLGLQSTSNDIHSPTIEKQCDTTESSASGFEKPLSGELDEHISSSQRTSEDISPTVKKQCNTTESRTSRFGKPLSDGELDEQCAFSTLVVTSGQVQKQNRLYQTSFIHLSRKRVLQG